MHTQDSLSLVPLCAHADERGMLVAIEGRQDVPFPIERVYFIVCEEGMPRGFHAHRNLDQLIVCVKGSCRLIVDDGKVRQEVLLDKADRGCHVGPMIWREMWDMSSHCILLILASAHHDESDYIRNYEQFLAEIKERDIA